MTTENKRDLAADLALCNETEPTAFVVGPTSSEGTSVLSSKRGRLVAKTSTVDIAEFISEAREGWPEAIRRALAAEAEVERLEAFLRSESELAISVIERMEAAEKENARLRSALETTQFHLDREQYMSASDTVDSALEVDVDVAE